MTNSAPHNDKYSPLWDAHPAIWTDAAIAAGVRTRQMKFDDIREFAARGYITGPGGSFGPGGFVIN